MEKEEPKTSHNRSKSMYANNFSHIKASMKYNMPYPTKRNNNPILSTHKRNRSDAFQKNQMPNPNTNQPLESPQRGTFNPRMSGHRRATSLSMKQMEQQQEKPLIQHSVQNHHNPNNILRTSQKHSLSEMISKNPRIPRISINENPLKKKNAHRRAASLSMQEHEQQQQEKPQQPKRFTQQPRPKKPGDYSRNIEEMLDTKHKQLLSNGIISPPSSESSPLSSPLSSPTSHNFLAPHPPTFTHFLNKSLDFHSFHPPGSKIISSPPTRFFVLPNDVLSTWNDIDEELDASFEDEDSLDIKNKGRSAPNPFKMISGGRCENVEPVDEGHSSAWNNGAQPHFKCNTPILMNERSERDESFELDQDYFQRRRSNSLNLSCGFLANEFSAFESYQEQDFDNE